MENMEIKKLFLKQFNKLYRSFYINYHKFWYGVRDERASFDLPYFISKNKDAKEKYVIFRYDIRTYLVFAAGRNYLFAYQWAKKHNMIPLIDMEWEYEFEHFRIGEDNLWDYFFEQPITVKEAISKDWVLIQSLNARGLKLHPYDRLYNGKKNDYFIRLADENWREYYQKIYPAIKECWKLNSEMEKKCDLTFRDLIDDKDRVVGIFLREKMSKDAEPFIKGKAAIEVFNKHPKTISVAEIIKLIEDNIDKWKCNKIFIATQYEETIDRFISCFGKKVIFIDRERLPLSSIGEEYDLFNLDNNAIHEKTQEDAGVLKEQLESYITEVKILSMCNVFVAPKCSGTIAALVMNGGNYEDYISLPDLNESVLY